jgi:hypothetical protein
MGGENVVDPFTLMVGAGSGLVVADIVNEFFGKQTINLNHHQEITVPVNTGEGIIWARGTYYSKLWGSFSKPKNQWEASTMNSALFMAAMVFSKATESFTASMATSLSMIAMAMASRPKERVWSIPMK